ncbi:magnesium and cobalt transporter [Candidatus Kinetoplastibacterium oncopeltii TCC290E]|uniref:Magnesium and cobalt transporter n=1 Tax=Candidatus Kinetoplastidibacterium stringomonadis TCC290E TaxID=1208920 RepID=M1L6A9_9PROT|nr:transporter associated domain-containing protein [Candidatus Kinetoplastibacterium oncopeltii]AGF48138.1 magnesium and cobalt transporter [Candidatus Kinetoplastibacterium oncopeltii TCC290E]
MSDNPYNNYTLAKFINRIRSLSKNFFTFLKQKNSPKEIQEIKILLEEAHIKGLIDLDALSAILGTINISKRTVSDIMIPRSKMNMLEISMSINDMTSIILETTHSRFPVFENERDNVIGVLLAKDLLKCISNKDIEIRSLIRPAFFIPESKKLNILLREFRISHNHQAIIIDEHGGISGLVTMEDILEQLVGNIEDEFDHVEENSIFQDGPNQWIVMAATDIDHLNNYLNIKLPNHEYDSVGGWLGGQINRIPKCGDSATCEDVQIEVIRADSRRALWLKVRRV